MHDVRMQLLDVFRWVCPGGEFRQGGAIQGSVCVPGTPELPETNHPVHHGEEGGWKDRLP